MYNYRNNSRNGRRRMRGIYGFPWLLFVIILFNFHSLPWIIMTFIVMGFVFLIIKAFMTTSNAATNGMRSQQTYQPYQQPTPIYQPPYQPYEQGYQAPPEAYQEAEQQSDYPVSETYDQYEQPQAQYPEQMPPMQQ
jgi:hypothetical protein